MSAQDDFRHGCMGCIWKARGSGFFPTEEEKASLLENNHHTPLGDSSDTLEPSAVNTAPLIPVRETKLYKRRWVMLLIFSAYSMSNAFMWLQYSIISNIFTRFYNTDTLAIDWLSMIYFVTYIPLILPVMWLLDKRGMRDIAVVGSAFNCVGAWIKTSTADPSLFYMALLGQFVCSVATVYILSIPSKLASLWFGPQEVSTACSIGVLGNQVRLGLPFGFKKITVCMVFCFPHIGVKRIVVVGKWKNSWVFVYFSYIMWAFGILDVFLFLSLLFLNLFSHKVNTYEHNRWQLMYLGELVVASVYNS